MTKENKSPLNINPENLATLEGVLRILKNNIFTTLNVCIPATVISYNTTNNTVEIQPAIQRILTNNEIQDRAIIPNVPVLELGGNGLSIKIPLTSGDTGIVVFCDRDISLFKQEKKNTQPNTLRKHDLSDGIFIPMRFGKSGSNNILIQSEDGATKLEITSTGINIKGNVNIEGDVVADGISLKQHTHPAGTYSNSAGAVSGKSGVPQ